MGYGRWIIVSWRGARRRGAIEFLEGRGVVLLGGELEDEAIGVW